jgi:hypothetical protein
LLIAIGMINRLFNWLALLSGLAFAFILILEQFSPVELPFAVAGHRWTIDFTIPTFMISNHDESWRVNLSSLREFDRWTGKRADERRKTLEANPDWTPEQQRAFINRPPAVPAPAITPPPPIITVARMPLAIAWLLSGALPTVWYALLLRREKTARDRRANNQCIACGYDLRSSPDRCPECGTAVRAGNARPKSPV